MSARLRFGAGKLQDDGVARVELMLRTAEHACRCKGGEFNRAADGRQQQRPVVELIVFNVMQQKQRESHLEEV